MAVPSRFRRPALALLLLAVIVGVAVAVVIAVLLGAAWAAPLAGWDAAAFTYLVWTWTNVARLDADDTRRHASYDDPTVRVSELILIGASLASLVAVGLVLVRAGDRSGAAQGGDTALGVLSVVLGWIVVHTIFTLRYARVFHDAPTGGIDFNEPDAEPRYADFAYVAFTIGMTFQVSDTSFTLSRMRSIALRHALLSYIFGTVIIATTINLVVGLAR
ncbi:MAG TPA: DUF1345 domain-containing protein [Micromonosporaceae bacterium]